MIPFAGLIYHVLVNARRSVEWSAQQGIVKSCTVRVDNKIRCIRDGATWYDCPGGSDPEDLVKEIEALYKERNG